MAGSPKVEFKVNLQELFGARLEIDEATKESIGQAIIDKIVERTQNNIDKRGRSLGVYKQDNKYFHKEKGGPVDLTQTGDMLAALTIVDTTAQTITIGYDDTEQNDKAYGHISGFEGHPVLEGKVRKRDFLGLPKSELENIGSSFESDVKTIDRINRSTTRAELDAQILSAIDELTLQIIPAEEL